MRWPALRVDPSGAGRSVATLRGNPSRIAPSDRVGLGARGGATVFRKLRPSPALVVALLALFVAVSGTAYAAATINGRDIADHSISGRKLVDDTVTGRQVNESTLAAQATQTAAAPAALTTVTVFYAPPAATAHRKTILHLGGLVLTASCAHGDLEVTMTSTADHAHLSSEMWNSAGDGNADGLHHSDFGPNSASHLDSLGDGNAYGETSFTYTRAGGIIVNGQLSFDSSDLNPFHPGDGDIFDHTAACLVSGFVTSTTASAD
jgi:hypothetical protein